MSLKQKISLVIVVAIIGYGALAYVVQRHIVMPNFLSLEKEEALKDMHRCVETLERETHHLDTLCVDWAAWNDTYEFVENRNEKYKKSNLNAETFKANSLSLLLLFDGNQRLIWGQLLKPETTEFKDPAEVQKLFVGSLDQLISHKNLAGCVKGIARTQHGPMIISSRPIITSEHTGPIRGTLIMGRLLDESLVQKISEQACVPMHVWPIQDGMLDSEQRRILSELTPARPERIIPFDDKQLDVYATAKSIHGVPALLIKAEMTRDVSAKGAAASRIAMISILVSGVLLLLLILAALERIIIHPLSALTRYVNQAGQDEDVDPCPAMQRNDEIGVLAKQSVFSFRELQKRERLLAGVAGVGACLLQKADFDDLRDVLRVLGTAVESDRAYIFENRNDPRTGNSLISQRFEWVREGIIAQIDNAELRDMTSDQLPLLYEFLSAGKPVRGLTKDFPTSVRTMLRSQQIMSILLVPIFVEDKFWGFIGFDDCHAERQWTATEESLLIAASSNIGNAIMRKRAQDAMTEAMKLAERANASKSDFLATMSHEIRTPMNGVVGMAHILAKTHLTPQQQRYAGIIKSSAESLLMLINDILDFSKIEAGKLELKPVDFNLPALVEDVAEMFSLKAAQKDLELASVIEPGIPRWVRGDGDRLRQILVNLVGNAMKFTDRGEVFIRVAVETVSPDKTCLRFEVSDTGVGIAEKDQALLFKSFSQVDSSATRKHGGTGLGLAISKRLVEMMGGQIGARSKAGSGSTFWFTADLAACPQPAQESHAILQDLQNLRVLCVDDNAAHRQILNEQLTSWRFDSETARDGVAALQMLRDATEAGKPFGVVIVDSHMPGISGVELFKAIRNDPQIRQNVRIIMTYMDESIDPQDMAEAGIHYCLTKPIRQSRLFDAIAEAVACAARRDAAFRQEIAPALRQPGSLPAQARDAHILLAEDNKVNQMLAAEILYLAGYRYDIASNGVEAVEAAMTRKYDLVLMDCQMPELDGLDAARMIRAKEAAGMTLARQAVRIPIIALTANAIAGDREQCLEAGMDEYISKPINPDELVKKIETLLPSPARPQAPHETAGETTPRAEGAAPATPSADSVPLNWEELAARCMGQHELALGLLETFLSQAPLDVETMSKALSGGNAVEATRLAHSFKGAAANLAAPALRQVAAELEQHCHANRLDDARDCFSRFTLELDRCLNGMRTILSNALAPKTAGEH